MKIKNPHHISDAEKFITANRARIVKHFSDNSGKADVTAAELRAAMPEIAEKLTDGMLAEIAKREGWQVEND